MSCPTCDHTMPLLGRMREDPVFICPRCGTICIRITKDGGGFEDQIHVPKLVERCREFENDLHTSAVDAEVLPDFWVTRGIAEAINKPENRK